MPPQLCIRDIVFAEISAAFQATMSRLPMAAQTPILAVLVLLLAIVGVVNVYAVDAKQPRGVVLMLIGACTCSADLSGDGGSRSMME